MPDRTQKEIAAKYKDNLTYYKQGHYMRRLRFWLSVVAVVGGLVWALAFEYLGGTPEFFNTGPISQNHSRFKDDCSVCHVGATTDLFSMLPTKAAKMAMAHGDVPLKEILRDAGRSIVETAKAAPVGIRDMSSDKLMDAADDMLANLNLDKIDAACVKCHSGMSLHQPGEKSLALRESSRELAVVQASACSVCHKEHVGSARMKLPTSETCVTCHADEQRLQASLKRVPYNGSMASIHSHNHSLGDLTQWLPPTTVSTRIPVIQSFTKGHPAFRYEAREAEDKANIEFNHARHFASDIPKVNDRALTCADCHQPDVNGVGMQRISYTKHCQSCHALGLDPKLPGFNLPHREPEHVRDFLGNLNDQWSQWAEKNIKDLDAASRAAFVQDRARDLMQRWPRSMDESVKKAFYIGDPAVTGNDAGQTLPACVKCHEVKDAKPVPIISPTKIPDQWLSRGPFRHVAHGNMDCMDCHGAAKESRFTADILLPSKKLCAECHRERDYSKVEVDPISRIAPTYGKSTRDAAIQQRKEGGVFDDCLSCHKYHVPAAEMEIARALSRALGK